MQLKEKTKDGLHRVYDIKVAAKDLQGQLDTRVESLRPQMRLKGFRPGKAPVSHIRKLYGRAIMGEIVENILKEAQTDTLEKNNIRAATQPKLELTSDVEKVLQGEEDLKFELALEVMPEFEVGDLSDIELTRPTADVSDEDIEKEMEGLAETATSYAEKKGAAKAGDQVIIDFVGKIDGEEFSGGKAEDAEVVIGAGRFIPGFEEGLTGAKAGDTPTLKVTFPEDYPAEHLRGKDAEFDTTVKAVKAPEKAKIDDELAKRFGLSSLDALKEAIKGKIENEYGEATRQKMKRQLLDAMDERFDFDLPPSMLEDEFNSVWGQVKHEMEQGQLNDEDKDKSEDELKEEYKAIAERRVRLGLVLAEIGRDAKIQVGQSEMARAINAQAAQFPGQEKEVAQYFAKNPEAMARLRAPIFEEKVMDHIFSLAKVKDVTVSKDELFKEDEAPAPKKKKPAKKANTSKAKTTAKKDSGTETKKDTDTQDKAEAKKPAAKKTTAKAKSE